MNLPRTRPSGGHLDGAVLAAGLGPGPGEKRKHLIAQVNYLGVVEFLEAWRPALAANVSSFVVIVSSNSTTTVPAVPRATVRAFLRRDVAAVMRSTRIFGKNAGAMVYAASKIAVTRWMRRTVAFMFSEANRFMVGATVFVDGGTDALYRSDDWPTAVPLRRLARYLRVTKEFNAARGRG